MSIFYLHSIPVDGGNAPNRCLSTAIKKEKKPRKSSRTKEPIWRTGWTEQRVFDPMSHRRSSPLLPVTMSSISTGRSPREELEDGEICDDDPDESVTSPPRRGDGGRLRGEAPPLARKPYQRPHNFRLSTPYNPGPQPFPPGHRQQCGPSGPDRPRPASVPPLPPPGLGPHGEPSPRSSFWERSHGALGRFRHRGMPNGGRGAWNRGGWSGSRAPPGRYGLEDGHCRTESPSRKRIL